MRRQLEGLDMGREDRNEGTHDGEKSGTGQPEVGMCRWITASLFHSVRRQIHIKLPTMSSSQSASACVCGGGHWYTVKFSYSAMYQSLIALGQQNRQKCGWITQSGGKKRLNIKVVLL